MLSQSACFSDCFVYDVKESIQKVLYIYHICLCLYFTCERWRDGHSPAWQRKPVILAPGRLMQEDRESKPVGAVC